MRKLRVLGVMMAIIVAGAAEATPPDVARAVDAGGILSRLGGDHVLVVPADGRPQVLALGAFIDIYGDPGVSELFGARSDPGEDIIPTPGEPPPDPDWSPGDTVHYWRDAIRAGSYFTRLTVYRYTGSNTWYRMSNTLSLPAPVPPGCVETPCAPIFEENPK